MVCGCVICQAEKKTEIQEWDWITDITVETFEMKMGSPQPISAGVPVLSPELDLNYE